MTDLWNPRNPRIIGLEWPVRKTVTYTLDSIGKSYAWVCRSSVAEQISQATFFADAVSGGNAKYAVEVYNLDDATLAPEGLSVGTNVLHATPSAAIDQDGTGNFDASNAAGEVNAITTGHDCSTTVATASGGAIQTDDAGTSGATYLTSTMSVAGERIFITTAIQPFDLTGQRIIAVTVRARAVGVAASISPMFALRRSGGAGNPSGGVPAIPYVGEERAMGTYLNGAGPCQGATSPDAVAPLYEWRYERNPLTNFPWTDAEIEAYMVGASDRTSQSFTPGFPMIGVQFASSQPTTCALLFFEVEIEYAAEDRQSYGYQDIEVAGFKSIPLVPFNKNANETLLIVARKMSDGPGSMTIRGLESDGFCPIGYTTLRPQILNRAGQVGLPLGTEFADVAGILLRRSDNVYSVDSQVYMGMQTLDIDQNSSATQTFTCDVAGLFAYLSLVASTQNLAPPDGPLTISIHQYSDAAQVGSSIILGASDLNEAPQLLQYIGEALATAAPLSAATTYYIQCTSPSSPGNGWTVAVLDTFNSSGAQNAQNFGGADGPPGGLFAYPDTATASFNGGQDMPFTVVQAPATPRGFTVTKAQQ